MSKAQAAFVCQSCGSAYRKWQGKCDGCGEWNSITQEIGVARSGPTRGLGRGTPVALTDLQAPTPHNKARLTTGLQELDRALGGGLVPGSAILIGGDPGIGKSTLLLQAAARTAGAGAPTLYLSGEEGTGQIQMRAERLGLASAPLQLGAATNLADILATLQSGPAPALVVIDSIQTLYADTVESAPGSVAQVRACAHELIRFAKARETALILVGHVTKDGQIAGPRVLEHMVDTVLYFEGDRSHQFQILRAVKNRFGGADEIGVFEMTGTGLAEVANPSALFLSDRSAEATGAAVFAGIEGSRPVLVEMQALVAPSPAANPRRAVVGWDGARLAMVLAVLDARAGLGLAGCDVYLNVAGGLRIQDPAADLAVAAALISALTEKPLPHDSVYFGELALSGDVRTVAHSDLRLKEAAKLGFATACLPLNRKRQGTPALALKTVETAAGLAASIAKR